MPKRMLVHDRRLGGNAPNIAQNTYVVDENVHTSHIIRWVGQYATQQSGLDELIIMCHGYAVLQDNVGQMTHVDAIGAQGLQLGKEGLTFANTSLASSWKPNVRNVYLYACGVSAESIHNNPAFDGRRFCGELALYCGAQIYAADVLQWYHRRRTRWQQFWGSNEDGTIDFGTWEGQVYRYSPDDGAGTPVNLGSQPS